MTWRMGMRIMGFKCTVLTVFTLICVLLYPRCQGSSMYSIFVEWLTEWKFHSWRWSEIWPPTAFLRLWGYHTVCSGTIHSVPAGLVFEVRQVCCSKCGSPWDLPLREHATPAENTDDLQLPPIHQLWL